MGIDLKIHGFNIRVVNGYAPTAKKLSSKHKRNKNSLLLRF